MKTITISRCSNPVDAEKRRKFLENIEKNTDTDVLEILSNAASKKGSNDKVRKFKSFI